MAQNNEVKNAEAKDAAKAQTSVKSQAALREERILKLWNENEIFRKTLEKNKGKKEFVFYDGPPFATGTPHYGHLIPGTKKDVIPRFKTMQGFYVERRWGWDCHGLPIENLVEKELNLATKKDILNFGIDKFNKAARECVFRYVDEWKRIIPRTGRFVDMDNAYVTMSSNYTESVWWSFKALSEKGLVYEGFKVMPYCPRCETTLSNFEVNQGYKDIADISAYVKFPLEGEKDTFFVAWTTTPWTLPGNAALAVNPDVDYVRIKSEGITYILAKARVAVVKVPYEITGEMKGSELVGKSYTPPFSSYTHANLKNKQNAWKVYGASFVTTEDGTGIVHIAPAFGGDDYELSLEHQIPVIVHVTPSGEFKSEVKEFAGMHVKPKGDSSTGSDQAHQKGDVEVIKWLAHNGLLFAKEKITHSYPHCWRCDTPLLNYATSSWFVKVTDLKDKLVSANKKVKWTPENIGQGRFGKWLEGARDWAVSRSRFWGAPLPVWKCDTCTHVDFVGGIEELCERTKSSNTFYVMRHGEAENNVKNVVNSDLSQNTFSLTEKGVVQVDATIEKLKGIKFDAIYVSPFLRARETADQIARALNMPGEQVITDHRLCEIGTGEFNGKSIDKYHEYSLSVDRFVHGPRNGENYQEAKKRVVEFMYEVDRKHEGKTILVVTHDTPAWLMVAGIRGRTAKETLELHSGKRYFLANAELREVELCMLPHNEKYELDLHRPYIDDVVWRCHCGKGTMKRVPEVFDTWYDSGSMPYASFHYPFEKEFDPSHIPLIKSAKKFPADFIDESLDQTRGWFYTLLVLSVGLFGKAPYKHVGVNGLLLAEDGRKMSKKLKNYPDVNFVIDKYGADALRYYLMSSPVVRAEDVRFSEKGVDEVYKKNILRLDNVAAFYEMYATNAELPEADGHACVNVLDRWILARLEEVRVSMTGSLEAYDIDKAAWPIEKFVDDLSTWYLRRSRERLKGDNILDRTCALVTLQKVLVEFSKLIAPFMPFIADDIYVRAGGKLESVHLESWPTVSYGGEAELIEDMSKVRELVTKALELRSKANIKVRQPLAKLSVKGKSALLRKELLELVREEVNVKEVLVDQTIAEEVVLDTVLTAELKDEGTLRDILRAIQEERKTANLVPTDKILVEFETNELISAIIEKGRAELAKIAGVRDVKFAAVEAPAIKLEAGEVKMRIVR